MTHKRIVSILAAAAMLAAPALLFIALCSRPAPGQGATAAYVKVFTGITAAQASAPVRNFGQTMHLVYVMFPGQSTTQSGLQVRIEASFDNSTYFPISEDITTAANVGGTVYDITSAFGPWPFIRVRSLTTAPAAMTVYYSGHTIPAVSTIQERSDRFIL